MIELLSPWALVGLAALTVPLLIHLIRHRTAAVVKVGSVRFLKKTASAVSKRLQLTEWLLLLLRIAILSLLTLLLAEPVWRSTPHSEPAAGWALINPELYYHTTDPSFFSLLDSLHHSGLELRWLAAGFPPFAEGDSLVADTESVWSLLAEADARLPAGAPLCVLTSHRLTAVRGSRPTLYRPVQWYAFAFGEKHTWIHSATAIGQDSVWVIAGESTPRHTRFYASWQSAAEVRLRGIAVNAPAPPLVAAIVYDDTRQHDAQYLEQGLHAVSQVLKKNIKVVRTRAIALPDSTRWVFWLTDSAVPESVWQSLRAGTMLWLDARTQGDAVHRSFKTPTGERIALWRRTPASPHSIALWYDDAGEPLLEVKQVQNVVQYDFHSRFSPEWNEFVFSSAFPEWLMEMLEPPLTTAASNDLRRLTDWQRQPQQDSSLVRTTTTAAPAHQPMDLPIWIFATILFIIERRLSQRQS